MAFPVPDHLPRRAVPQDISSQVLSKLDEATNKSLNADLAASWVHELDDTIHATKKRIHERIRTNLPEFERQLHTSQSVQTKLYSLSTSIDTLTDTVSNPQTGLIPTLLHALTSHSQLAQHHANAEATSAALRYLKGCLDEWNRLEDLAKRGQLPDMVSSFGSLTSMLYDNARPPVSQSDVLVDFKRRLNALKARTEEQLSVAYQQCVTVSATEMVLKPSITLGHSQTELSLASIVSSLSSSAVDAYASILCRDITAHVIEPIIKGTTAVEVQHYRLKLVAAREGETESPLTNLSIALDFLSTNLFPVMPTTSIRRSLCKPITSATLHIFLLPSLPTRFVELEAFRKVVKQAVEFEGKYIVEMLGNDLHDRPIQAWAEGLNGHYERQRRKDILNQARKMILEQSSSETFLAELELEQQEVLAEQVVEEDEQADAWGLEGGAAKSAESAGWGFEDEVVEDTTDADDAWGWNDDTAEENVAEEENAWDDPWGEEPADDPTPAPAPPSPSVPKVANGLVRKGKKTPGVAVDPTPPPPPPPAPVEHPPTTKRPPAITVNAPPKETYLVSQQMKDLLSMVQSVLAEGLEFSSGGSTISKSASSILDLYRALKPLTLSTPKDRLLFSNDCLYLSSNIDLDCKESLKTLSSVFLEDVVDSQRDRIREVIQDGAQGFTYTGEQERYDDCEEAVNTVLQHVRTVAKQWKGILPKSVYYTAIGSLVDTALERVLADILALPDIPEMESRRLADLCRILNAFEGLFVEDDVQTSFVVAYVPLWLKYSYLSELLEASMVDMTYLFETGALIDFEVDELIRLVRALFADGKLRTNLIYKLEQGQPASA